MSSDSVAQPTPKFGVQFQSLSGNIDAGRLATQAARTVFRDKCDVTGYAIWAVGEWLLAHYDGEDYEMTQPSSGRTLRFKIEEVVR